MLSIEISPALAKEITPSFGITNQEFTSLRTGTKKYVEEWLQERQRGEHAWSMDPYNKPALERVKDIVQKAKHERVQAVVWIGIGGSGLGPKVLQEVFETPTSMEFLVIDTIDPMSLAQYAKILDWNQTFLVVASKSGETLETMSA